MKSTVNRNKLKAIRVFFSDIRKSLKYYIFRAFPVKKKIVICNFDGKGYGDNPKYIADLILKKKLHVDLVWLVDKGFGKSMPEGIRAVNIRSLRAVYELVTAKVWIDNGRKPFFTRKRKKQYYIQTWHGCMMMKKIEKDAEDKLDFGYLKSAINDSKMIDLCVSNSDFMTGFYTESFWYRGEVLQCGSPKTDFLLNSSDADVRLIKDKLNITENKKIVLYAPTFRNDHSTDVYISDFEVLLQQLDTTYGEEWVVLLRLHPAMVGKASTLSYNERVLNLSDYNDMQELLLAADILITDYSSTMFEFYLMGKPVFLYTVDVDRYENERGLYFNFDTVPFPKASNMEELKGHIANFDKDTYNDQLRSFMDNIGFTEDGSACEKIVSRIESVLQ